MPRIQWNGNYTSALTVYTILVCPGKTNWTMHRHKWDFKHFPRKQNNFSVIERALQIPIRFFFAGITWPFFLPSTTFIQLGYWLKLVKWRVCLWQCQINVYNMHGAKKPSRCHSTINRIVRHALYALHRTNQNHFYGSNLIFIL